MFHEEVQEDVEYHFLVQQTRQLKENERIIQKLIENSRNQNFGNQKPVLEDVVNPVWDRGHLETQI